MEMINKAYWFWDSIIILVLIFDGNGSYCIYIDSFDIFFMYFFIIIIIIF